MDQLCTWLLGEIAPAMIAAMVAVSGAPYSDAARAFEAAPDAAIDYVLTAFNGPADARTARDVSYATGVVSLAYGRGCFGE